jgi:Beta/Gamma crystallin
MTEAYQKVVACSKEQGRQFQCGPAGGNLELGLLARGRVKMADLMCWDDVGYRGQLFETSGDIIDLTSWKHSISGNWNDEICSFKVIAGQWRFFEHVSFGGLGTQIFKAGDQVRSCPDAGFPNNWISSIQRVG